jgi:hypothetical protein
MSDPDWDWSAAKEGLVQWSAAQRIGARVEQWRGDRPHIFRFPDSEVRFRVTEVLLSEGEWFFRVEQA